MVYSILRNVVFFLLITAGFSPLEAHIFNVQKLVKDSHTVMLLSDFHSKTNAEQERAAIVKYAKKCGGAVIVEDSSIPLGHNVKKQTDGSLYQWPLYADQINRYQSICTCPTTVFMLYSAAVNNGVAASNIEFRFDDHLTLRDIFKVIEKKKEKFCTLVASSQYGSCYKTCLEYLKTNIEDPCAALFEKLSETDLSIEKALKSNTLHATDMDIAQANKVKIDRNYKLTLKREIDAIDHLYNDYCNILLEMEMIHAIEQYNNYKTVFVCAGAAHNAQIARILLANGYQMAQEIGNPIPKIFDANDYAVMSQQTIDLEEALNTVCAQAAPQSGPLTAVAGYVSSFIAYCISFLF